MILDVQHACFFFFRCISASSPIVTGYPPSRFMFDWRSQFLERKEPSELRWCYLHWSGRTIRRPVKCRGVFGGRDHWFGKCWIWDIIWYQNQVVRYLRYNTRISWSVALICMYTHALMTFRCVVLMNYMFLSSLSYRLTPPRAAQGTFEHLKPWQLQLHPQHWYCHCNNFFDSGVDCVQVCGVMAKN